MPFKFYISESFTCISNKPLADVESTLKALVDLDVKWYDPIGNKKKEYFGKYYNSTFKIYPKYYSWLTGYTIVNSSREVTYLKGILLASGNTIQVNCNVCYKDLWMVLQLVVIAIAACVFIISTFFLLTGLMESLYFWVPSLITIIFVYWYHSYSFCTDRNKYKNLIYKICN